MLRKMSGGFLLVVGYLLSPLCWWNDIIINLPVAYGIGWLCHLVSPQFLIPGTIVGYWITNVLGMLLIQFGTVDLMQKQQERNFQKEFFNGLVSSTVYTLVIIALIQFKILDASSLLSMITNKNS